MDNVIDLAEYRQKRDDEEISQMRQQLHIVMARWVMTGMVFVSPVPPLGLHMTDPTPVHVPIQIL